MQLGQTIIIAAVAVPTGRRLHSGTYESNYFHFGRKMPLGSTHMPNIGQNRTGYRLKLGVWLQKLNLFH